MQFTNEVKDRLEKAESAEEVKNIISETKKGVEEAGVILDDAELDKAAGGCRLGESTRDTKFR